MKKNRFAVIAAVILAAATISIESCSQRVEKKELTATIIPFDKIASCEFDSSDLRDWELSTICFKSEESGLGRLAEIDKIIERNGKYYVLDRAQKAVFRYSSLGEPLNRIGQKGRGPKEYLTISDYSVNPSGQVVILDGQLDEIIVYNDDGTFVSRKKANHDYGELFLLDNGEILLGCNAWDESDLSGSKLILADSSFVPHTVISSFIQGYDPNFVLPHIGFTEFNGIVSYVCPIDDHVYVTPKKGGESKVFLINFGDEKVEDDQLKNIENSFPDIRQNKSLLLNATLIDDLAFIMTVFDKGKLVDLYVDAKGKRKISLTPLGVRFLGGSGKSLFFEVTNPDKMTEPCEKMVMAISRRK